MSCDSFIDTSGFYAVLVKRDEQHNTAAAILRKAGKASRFFVTSDYVLDETATLLKARGLGHLLSPFFQIVEASDSCRIEWTDQDVFFRAKNFFLKHLDHAYSFTDCVSFEVMKALRVKRVLSKDEHFREAGFTPLLA